MIAHSLASLLALIAPGGEPTPQGTSTEDAAQPNVLLIFTDDQGWADLGVQGARGFTTPHLDRLAEEGTRFTEFYVAAAVCTPSRAALLTGCYPNRLSLGKRVVFPFDDHGLNPEERTLAEALGDVGYRTACIGKWHLGHREGMMPLDQGFDHFYGVPYSHDMDGHHYRAQDFVAPPLPVYRDRDIVAEAPPAGELTSMWTREAIAFLERTDGEPFFLYLPHCMPHLPWATTEAYRGSSEEGAYGDVLQELDASVGELMAALDRLGLRENTIVLFTSDNGPRHRGSALPLRGGKNTTWEGGHRVPFLISWPGHIPARRTSPALVTALDLLPTLAGWCGAQAIDPAQARKIDGLDLGDVLRGVPGTSNPRTEFLYFRDERLQAVRQGRFKLHVHRPEWKDTNPGPLLYDLEADPGEARDCAHAYPEVVRRLEALAREARSELGDAARGIVGRGIRPAGGPPR